MAKDPMADHYEHDAREYHGVRPKDLDDALIGDLRKVAGGMDSLSAGIEGIKKRNWPTILMAFSMLSFAFTFGIWVTNYNRNANDGSPALVKMDQRWSTKFTELDVKITAISAKDDSRYDKLSEILTRVAAIQEQQGERLNRVEDRNP